MLRSVEAGSLEICTVGYTVIKVVVKYSSIYLAQDEIVIYSTMFRLVIKWKTTAVDFTGCLGIGIGSIVKQLREEDK